MDPARHSSGVGLLAARPRAGAGRPSIPGFLPENSRRLRSPGLSILLTARRRRDGVHPTPRPAPADRFTPPEAVGGLGAVEP